MKVMKSVAACLVLGTALAAGQALAEYPERPITYIIGYGAGGTSDVGARTWGPYMEACLGQPIVFINKPGAGGEIAFTELASLAPDGYTLGALNMPNFPSGAITKTDPKFNLGSFDYLAAFYGSIMTLNAKRGGKYETLEDLVAAAKSGEKINMAISNYGADDHIKMLEFMRGAGIAFNFIPMGDAANSRNAVMGGHVDVSGNSMTEVAPFQEDIVTLGVASEAPRAELPGVKTFVEQGYNIVGGSTHVIGAPAGLPPEIYAKLTGCFAEVAQNPEFQKVATERSLLLQFMDNTQTKAWVEQDFKTFQALWDADPWVN